MEKVTIDVPVFWKKFAFSCAFHNSISGSMVDLRNCIFEKRVEVTFNTFRDVESFRKELSFVPTASIRTVKM